MNGRLRSVVGIEWSAVATVWLGSADADPARAQPGECLRAGHLVDEVEVHGQDRGRTRILGHHMVCPDLVDDGARGGSGHLASVPEASRRGPGPSEAQRAVYQATMPSARSGVRAACARARRLTGAAICALAAFINTDWISSAAAGLPNR